MTDQLGPLHDGSKIVIIGGGPGGTACAIALLRLAKEAGCEIHVTIYESKMFATKDHYNQCAGVVSPPIANILEENLNIPFPHHLTQRRITGYILHGSHRSLILDGPPDKVSYALRRIEFDSYMLEHAQFAGAEVMQCRVTDLEFHHNEVHIYSESDCRKADVVVGAFGLDDGTAAIFSRTVGYRQPRFLTSIVTKVHSPNGFPGTDMSRIHAYLPPAPQIEFGAITPKANHLTINTAGANLDTHRMEDFLSLPNVKQILPLPDDAESIQSLDLPYFKGRFPISLARRFYGDRYVLVGDAAGLVRAFKGKGINSACQSGIWAAHSMFRTGISGAAFASDYLPSCREILRDIPYGKAVRRLVIWSSRLGLVDRALSVAEREPALRQALFDAVSGDRNYRDIVLGLLHPPLLWHLGRAFVFAPQTTGSGG
jgi:flavin-dependent dehydrogenase